MPKRFFKSGAISQKARSSYVAQASSLQNPFPIMSVAHASSLQNPFQEKSDIAASRARPRETRSVSMECGSLLAPSMPKLAPASPAGKPAETGRRQDRRTPRRKFHLRKSCLANGANLMYEGARVKSWMLGRDLNPGGRGYGDFFPHGMFQIGNLRPQASVTPTVGFGGGGTGPGGTGGGGEGLDGGGKNYPKSNCRRCSSEGPKAQTEEEFLSFCCDVRTCISSQVELSSMPILCPANSFSFYLNAATKLKHCILCWLDSLRNKPMDLPSSGSVGQYKLLESDLLCMLKWLSAGAGKFICVEVNRFFFPVPSQSNCYGIRKCEGCAFDPKAVMVACGACFTPDCTPRAQGYILGCKKPGIGAVGNLADFCSPAMWLAHELMHHCHPGCWSHLAGPTTGNLNNLAVQLIKCCFEECFSAV